MRSASVFHLAHRSPSRLERIDSREPLPPSDPPPRRAVTGAVLPKGSGPWQAKAMAMQHRESLVLTQAEAECFRSACRRLGFRTQMRTEHGTTQVWVFKQEQQT